MSYIYTELITQTKEKETINLK